LLKCFVFYLGEIVKLTKSTKTRVNYCVHPRQHIIPPAGVGHYTSDGTHVDYSNLFFIQVAFYTPPIQTRVYMRCIHTTVVYALYSDNSYICPVFRQACICPVFRKAFICHVFRQAFLCHIFRQQYMCHIFMHTSIYDIFSPSSICDILVLSPSLQVRALFPLPVLSSVC
jgi:hypothetical protein